MVYKRPQIERVLPKQTRSVFLEDYSDVDITKNITIETRGASGYPTTWSFAQTNFSNNMTLLFSETDENSLILTVIKPNGSARIATPISSPFVIPDLPRHTATHLAPLENLCEDTCR